MYAVRMPTLNVCVRSVGFKGFFDIFLLALRSSVQALALGRKTTDVIEINTFMALDKQSMKIQGTTTIIYKLN